VYLRFVILIAKIVIRYFSCTCFILFFFTCTSAQKLVSFDSYNALEKEILNDDKLIYVVNFWATWCGPCVKELPHFEQLNAENNKVKVILVSLDFKSQFDSKLLPFLTKKSLQSDVVFLSDTNYDKWLPMVDKNWSGSIPATLIIKNRKKIFIEKAFANYQELNEYVNSNTN
jgi:thiol-disulfide isomerase/thioredoxin